MSDKFVLTGTYSDDSYFLEQEVRTLRVELQTLDDQIRKLRLELVTHDHVRKDSSKVSIHEVLDEVQREIDAVDEGVKE